jgi:hypothetical protein
MLNITQSHAEEANPNLVQNIRKDEETNVEWLARVMPAGGENARLALLGGRNRCAFRLRVAQSHARQGLTPSHWSHVVLLEPHGAKAGSAQVIEISLERGFKTFPPATNAVQTARISSYANPRWYPNICVLDLPVKWEPTLEAARKFQTQRSVADAVELLVVWMSFVWGVGRVGNPLLDGLGMPSAVMVEYVVGAAGYDLTPGLANRSSCPEAIWQSARWWHDFYNKRSSNTALTGAFHVGHPIF